MFFAVSLVAIPSSLSEPDPDAESHNHRAHQSPPLIPTPTHPFPDINPNTDTNSDPKLGAVLSGSGVQAQIRRETLDQHVAHAQH